MDVLARVAFYLATCVRCTLHNPPLELYATQAVTSTHLHTFKTALATILVDS